jgi:hypothetical protein
MNTPPLGNFPALLSQIGFFVWHSCRAAGEDAAGAHDDGAQDGEGCEAADCGGYAGYGSIVDNKRGGIDGGHFREYVDNCRVGKVVAY